MEMLYSRAIERGKELLTDNPVDVYHTLDHHSEVVQNIFDIVNHEKLKLNSELLEVAAWWHDVFKDNLDEEKLLAREFSDLDLESKEIKILLEMISGHSFGQEQLSIEGKLLYDADKLALVSIPRWKYAFDQFDAGLITKEERDEYITEWNRRMPILKDKLNFGYSKRLFQQRHLEFTEWLRSIDRYKSGLMD